MFQEWSVVSLALIGIILYILIRYILYHLRIDNITNRHVLITGCDSGFGKLLAQTLDTKGIPVIAGCLTKEGATDLTKVTTSRLNTLVLDISDETSVARALQTVKNLLPKDAGLWGVVNNAGIMPYVAPAECTTLTEFRKVCDVNLFGSINVTLTFLPLVRQAQGRVVNVCSIIVNLGMAGNSSYCVSKAGLRMFTTCIRRELFGSGVTVHSIEPSGFRTAIMGSIRKSYKRSYRNASLELKEFYGGTITDAVFHGLSQSEPLLSSNLQLVVDAMDHALFGRFPKLRYVVGSGVPHVMFRFFMCLPEWLADHILGWPKPYGKTSKALLEDYT